MQPPSPQAKLERALRQAQDVFESEVPARSKELFLSRLPWPISAFRSSRGKKGRTDTAEKGRICDEQNNLSGGWVLLGNPEVSGPDRRRAGNRGWLANGCTEHPSYEEVCHNNTGHAETVRVVYDSQKLPLAKLLGFYFRSINPTSVNGRAGTAAASTAPVSTTPTRQRSR